MEIGKTLWVSERKAWRAWLEKYHASEPEIWLVYPNKASGKPRLPYNDAVEEALCFGWIDSIVKSLDADHAAQRFTPRRLRSPLSPMNAERMRRLIAERRMTPAGLAAVPGFDPQAPLVVAVDIVAALRADKETWRNYEAFPESYKSIRTGWIEGARKRPEVFEQRLRYFLKMTAQNKRFGLVQ